MYLKRALLDYKKNSYSSLQFIYLLIYIYCYYLSTHIFGPLERRYFLYSLGDPLDLANQTVVTRPLGIIGCPKGPHWFITSLFELLPQV
jgi:hypothetical protein